MSHSSHCGCVLLATSFGDRPSVMAIAMAGDQLFIFLRAYSRFCQCPEVDTVHLHIAY